MRSVVINGGRAIDVPVELQTQVAEVVADPTINSYSKHERICVLLSIGRFVPAPTHKPYALRAVTLQVYDASRCIATYGGWHECYNCHTNIDNKPQGQTCPNTNCKKGGIQNFKWEDPKKERKKNY